MKLKSLAWQPVPGMSATEIYPVINRPSIVSSNTYVLSAPDAIVVIDPGASASQTALLSQVVSAALVERARPVLVILTHCHQDHSQEAASLALPPGTEVIVCVETSGAIALEAGDRELTFCCYYPWETTVCQPDHAVRLFCGDPGGAVDAAGRVVRAADAIERPSGALRRERLTLGEGEWMEVYHTPGHSDCSITLRVGELMFLGDLPFAANPGLCGIFGWNQHKLTRSIDHVDWLLETSGVTTCLPGHGFAQSADMMRAHLQVMAEESSQLAGATTLSVQRVAALKDYLAEVLEEAGYLFSVISGQLYALSFHLSTLEEDAAGADVLSALDLDRVEQSLTEFQSYAREFNAETTPGLTLVMKGVQVIQRLRQALDGSSLDGMVDPSLAGRVQRLLDDFLSMARGLEFTGADHALEINDVVSSLLERIGADCRASLDAIPAAGVSDPDGFARLLVRQVAAQSLLQGAQIAFTPTPDDTKAFVPKQRFDDILQCLLEGIAGSGAEHIPVQTSREGQRVIVRLESANGPSESAFGARRLALYHRTLSRVGGGLTHLPGLGFDVWLPAAISA